MADQPDHAVDAPVDQARDAGGSILLRPGDHSRDDRDRVMHRLDQVNDPGDAGDGQPVDAAKIGSAYAWLLDHGQIIVVGAVRVSWRSWSAP